MHGSLHLKGLLHHPFTEFPFHVASVHKNHVHLNFGWAYRQVGWGRLTLAYPRLRHQYYNYYYR